MDKHFIREAAFDTFTDAEYEKYKAQGCKFDFKTETNSIEIYYETEKAA